MTDTIQGTPEGGLTTIMLNDDSEKDGEGKELYQFKHVDNGEDSVSNVMITGLIPDSSMR